MGFCSCGNWVDEGEVCSHCGGSGGNSNRNDSEILDEYTVDSHVYFYRKGKSSSIKGDHASAIGFYEEALRSTWQNREKCEMLSDIAEEYEKMGDYTSAEDYWNRACGVDAYESVSYVYMPISKKGDFLYRRYRYQEAINTYKEALKSLDGVNDRNMDMTKLKYYTRITHFIIDSYEKLGKDNQKDKYHKKLKHAIKRYIEARKAEPAETRAHYISKTAWDAYINDGMGDEAMILIDSAIELNPDGSANDYNRKAIMLDDAFQYEEALKYYDKALAKDPSSKVISKNRAECEAVCIKDKLNDKLLLDDVKPHDLDLINRALKVLPHDLDNGPYLTVKGDILKRLGDPVKAKVCYALAAKRYDEVEKADKQLKKLKPYETYINITGVQYYQHFEPFKEGVIVNLIKEPDNPHDSNAIRVEIKGKTVGYVANSQYTLIKEVESATDINDSLSFCAEVQFILFGEWVIAKLI